MADRLGLEHRAPERFRGADVGPGRAGLHGDAVADARGFDHAAGHNFALLDVIIELVDAKRDQIPGRAADDLLIQSRPYDLNAHDDRMPVRLLEACRQLAYP